MQPLSVDPDWNIVASLLLDGIFPDVPGQIQEFLGKFYSCDLERGELFLDSGTKLSGISTTFPAVKIAGI